MGAIEGLYDHYKWLVEMDMAVLDNFDPTSDPYAYVTEACAAWRGRYSRLQFVIDRLPDDEQRRRVMQAGINADLAITELPGWTPEEWQVYHLIEQNQPSDQPFITGLHAYGPSLRALWAEARTEGASHAEAWRHIWDWARRPASQSDFVDEVFLSPPRPPAPVPPPVYVPPPNLDPADLLPRYRAGERQQVWDDLVALGPLVREPRFEAHARAVATETMRRARRNVEVLFGRLQDIRYTFWDGELHRGATMNVYIAGRVVQVPNLFPNRSPQAPRTPEQIFHPSDPELIADADWLEARGLQLPMSVRAWFEQVGEVDFSGRHPLLCQFDMDPDFRGVHADPLMVFLEPGLLEGLGPPQDLDVALVLALDAAGKSGQASGGQIDDFYSVQVPGPGADAKLDGEANGLTFVQYLRKSFAWGGFPGWEGAADPPTELLRRLAQGLDPI